MRPKKNFLEVSMFLGRAVKAPQMRRVNQSSKSKLVHVVHITHRDQVEPPITDWLQEAYQLQDEIAKIDKVAKIVKSGKLAKRKK